MSEILKNEKKLKGIIKVLSIVIPVAVAALFGIKIDGIDLTFLPPVYASINGLTAVLLVFALVMVKQGNIEKHEFFMKLSMLCSAVFLLMYIAYHITSETTIYGGEGSIAIVYYFILISHILLSIVVLPLVLYSYLFAATGQIEKHKKLVRYAFPVWMYVAVTGVVVYLMISPYYA